MIQKILEEMFEECHSCQGTGVDFMENPEGIHEPECVACNGDGYDLSYLGHQLQAAIMKGEKP